MIQAMLELNMQMLSQLQHPTLSGQGSQTTRDGASEQLYFYSCNVSFVRAGRAVSQHYLFKRNKTGSHTKERTLSVWIKDGKQLQEAV